MKESVEELNEKLQGKSAEEILHYFLTNYSDKVILGSSMGAEDQVLTDMILKINRGISVFTLDTGRLFPETYELIEKTNKKYGIRIRVYFPDREKVEEMVNSKGINLFYESIENRKLCCNIRKIEPLKRALPGNDVWVTGLRKDQSLQRFNTKLVEWEDAYQVIKVNPLLHWTEKDVWKYIKKFDVPYNTLHDKGFPSIGCQPCTRAVKPDGDFRSGRWWWEDPEHNECGLHVKEEK
ncbi:MAG: phosphoadenylyl-sulfate reductase [Bacteroidales bacterium]|nr:phosphoadenylyl-sulfate reductase [Bacteroidales bacterium]